MKLVTAVSEGTDYSLACSGRAAGMAYVCRRTPEVSILMLIHPNVHRQKKADEIHLIRCWIAAEEG